MRRPSVDLEEKQELRGGMMQDGMGRAERLTMTRTPTSVCLVWSLVNGAVKPAATRPPAGRWGLTAPFSKDSGLTCRK